MKRAFTFLASLLICTVVMAQKPTAVIKRTTVIPILDGVIDEVWAQASANNIELAYTGSTPTIGAVGETYWKALWTVEGIFVIVNVVDDVNLPADKPEIYFDVNYNLVDGGGAVAGMGHSLIAPNFTDTPWGGVLYASKVTGSKYVIEYFVPYNNLKNSDGLFVDKTQDIGFDVNIMDADVAGDATNRAVWANTESLSWENMDKCGIIKLEGAADVIYAESIAVKGAANATTITVDNATLQMSVDIKPSNADLKNVTWEVLPGTGRAIISTTGQVSALTNGTVTVVAKTNDYSGISGQLELTISGQVMTDAEANLIKNGSFGIDGEATEWNNWVDNGFGSSPTVVDGVVVCDVQKAGEYWQYQFYQQGIQFLPELPYIFSFKASASVDRVIRVDFEDANNGNPRLGLSEDPESIDGTSDWNVNITTDPTNYKLHVIFKSDIITETTIKQIMFMIGQEVGTVYLDDIMLVPDINSSGSTQKYKSVIQIFPNPVQNELIFTEEVSQVRIISVLGQEVKRFSNADHKFNVSELKSGIYFVTAKNMNGIISNSKIVKN